MLEIKGIGWAIVFSLVGGLIVFCVLDPAYLPLASNAKTLVDRFPHRLRAGP